MALRFPEDFKSEPPREKRRRHSPRREKSPERRHAKERP